MIEVVDDVPDNTEPENLSTKPEDLSRSAPKRSRSPSPAARSFLPVHYPVVVKRMTSPIPTSRTRSPSPQPLHQIPAYQPHHHYPTKAISPPNTVAPIHPVAKKARIEVLQHDNSSSVGGSSTGSSPMHFMAAKSPMEMNLNTPVDNHYSTWARSAAPLPYTYLPYSPTYRYHPADFYPSYPVPAAYPSSSPEHQSVSPSPPHASLTCSSIPRPIARTYASHWTSPDSCGLSPTSSVGSSSYHTPPPVTPEDLSSPGSDSGRSSAGSISAGSSMVKIEKNSPVNSANPSSGAASTGSATSPRYQCPDCAKSYSTYSGLSKHQQFHCAAAEGQTKKSFTCKYCEKVYMTLGALKMHIRTHTLPCKCHLCGKAFSRPWLLQGHIRTHTGEKPFSCQHCNRAFADRSNLRAHLQTHSDVKKYSCSSCSKTFSRMSLLTKHQEGGCPGVAVPISYGC